jgi:hypothetical protein
MAERFDDDASREWFGLMNAAVALPDDALDAT